MAFFFSHNDLLTQDGVYANMWQQQLKNDAESQRKSNTDEEGSNSGVSAVRRTT